MPALDLTRYEHILLDMNGTFVFSFDRFGPGEDFGATYTARGHSTLTAQAAQARVRAAYDYMAVRYVDEAHYHDFPSVRRALEATRPLEEQESDDLIAELVDTFTQHELGFLPGEHQDALRWLAARRPISVLSNLWSPPEAWLELLEALGLRQNFHAMFFSSEGSEMKPHPAFFERAIDHLAAAPARILFVGDSYRCDVAGARGVGMDVVWLHGDRRLDAPLPDRVWAAADLPSWVASMAAGE